MAQQTQFRRGTTAQHASFTGAAGEVTVNTTRTGLHVHDGVTANGIITPNVIESQNQSNRYATGGGTGDVITVTLTPAPTAYTAGMKIKWLQPAANTTAATINVNGLGAKSIKKNVSSALSANDLLNGGVYEATYDGTNFQLNNAVSRSTGMALIMVKELTSQSVADFTGIDLATFGDYELRGWARPATDGVYPILQYGTGGGPTYGTSGYSGSYLEAATAAVTAMLSDGGLLANAGNESRVGNDSDNRFDFRFRLGDLGTAMRRGLTGEMSWSGSESTASNYWAYGAARYWSTTTAITALRFKFSSGNIAACWIGLYGYLRA